jgi:predicted RNase H-like nuclease (RuvC/YqgF family)
MSEASTPRTDEAQILARLLIEEAARSAALQSRIAALEAEAERLRKNAEHYRNECDRLTRRAERAEEAGSALQRAEGAIGMLVNACIQARGALRLDVMLDDIGKPYGTTTVALDAIDVALSAARKEAT